MTHPAPGEEPDDLSAAIREGRPLRPDRGYRLLIGDEKLSFKTVTLTDPLPLSRQIAEAIGARPAEEHVVIAMLPDGDLEDLRPDEPYDLRGRGAEKVLVVRSDRTFRLMVDTADLEWPKPLISGRVLKTLAKLPEGYDLYQEVRGGKGHDKLIEDCDLINLDDPGLERFISIEAETTEGRAQLPSHDDAYLTAEGLDHEVIIEGGRTGVVLKDYPLPEGVFDQTSVDLLILLPTGYPDACPDMFFVSPWIKVARTGRYAHAADRPHQFGGVNWQRWSRHSQKWRPGIDGLHTMIARARVAFDKCAS